MPRCIVLSQAESPGQHLHLWCRDGEDRQPRHPSSELRAGPVPLGKLPCALFAYMNRPIMWELLEDKV